MSLRLCLAVYDEQKITEIQTLNKSMQ